MTNIVIMNDVHFGVKNGSSHFQKYHEKVFDYILKYCVDSDIKDLLILGDIFDKRKVIDVSVIQTVYGIFEKFNKQDIRITITLGNHDVYYKDTNILNTPDQLLSHLPNVYIQDKPTPVVYKDGISVGMIPWITEDNYQECMEFIKRYTFDVLIGHFEISGFVMHKGGITLNHGLKQSLFAHHGKVLSGHYHHKSTVGNISYLGSQFQFTWADVDDIKYFHVLDIKDATVVPVEVPHKMYTTLDTIPDDIKTLTGMYVRMYTNEDLPEASIEEIESVAFDFKIYPSSETPVEEETEDKTVSLQYNISDKGKMLQTYSEKIGLDETGVECVMKIFNNAMETVY